MYAGARGLLLTSRWRGGDRNAWRAVVKHRWELEARGRPAWVEQAMPPGPTLDTAGRLGRRERPVCMGKGREAVGQCSTRSLSATRRSPASVKGGIAHPGGAQVEGCTSRPRKRLLSGGEVWRLDGGVGVGQAPL
ncbi:MAG TPA: hypothetical protein VIZ18_11785 [Ktedonobacteraceae bacterium]